MSIVHPRRQTTERGDERPKHLRDGKGGWHREACRFQHLLSEELSDLRSTLGEPDDYQHLHRQIMRVDTQDDDPDLVWQDLHRLEEEVARHASGHVLLDLAIDLVEESRDPLLKDNKAFSDSSETWQRVKEAAERSSLPSGVSDSAFAADVATLMHHAHSVADEGHAEANHARRRLVAAAVGAAVVSLLIVVASLVLKQLPFLVGGKDFRSVPTWQTSALVVMGGLVGGSWGALPAFTSTERDRYRLQYARAALRLSIGVLAALVGVSLVGAGWVTALTAGSASALFAVATAFGLAQEPITKVLEGKVQGAVPAEPGAAKPEHK